MYNYQPSRGSATTGAGEAPGLTLVSLATCCSQDNQWKSVIIFENKVAEAPSHDDSMTSNFSTAKAAKQFLGVGHSHAIFLEPLDGCVLGQTASNLIEGICESSVCDDERAPISEDYSQFMCDSEPYLGVDFTASEAFPLPPPPPH